VRVSLHQHLGVVSLEAQLQLWFSSMSFPKTFIACFRWVVGTYFPHSTLSCI